MATKKVTPAKETDKTFIEKIGEQAVHVRDGLVAGTGHLIEAAGHGLESVKEKM